MWERDKFGKNEDICYDISTRRWQSGQLHLTVNQTPSGYVGSNPTLRTRLTWDFTTQNIIRSGPQYIYLKTCHKLD